ncbi:MAG: hypothetical protein P8Y71_07295 [Pseudolabrys sp.]
MLNERNLRAAYDYVAKRKGRKVADKALGHRRLADVDNIDSAVAALMAEAGTSIAFGRIEVRELNPFKRIHDRLAAIADKAYAR